MLFGPGLHQMSILDSDTKSDDAARVQAEKERLFAYLDALPDLQTALGRRSLPANPRRVANSPPPKTVWLYWHQGWDEAPRIVKACRRSWALSNPDWEVRALDHDGVRGMFPDLLPGETASTLTGFSDLVRLKLLSSFGGVWSDATVFCSQPISTAVTMLTQSARFFAFSHPAAERLISTWFMAAHARAPYVAAWCDAVEAYFAALIRDQRRTHSYFYVHYIFEYIQRNPRLAVIYRLMPQVRVGNTGRTARLAGVKDPSKPLEGSLTPERLQEIERSLDEFPIHKLTWKGEVRTGSERAVQLMDLLEARLDRAAAHA